MNLKFKAVLCAALLGPGAALAADSAAPPYPARPIRFIAPYGAGGSYDLIARLFAQKLGEQMGQQVIVDNRAGASGRIGMEIAVKASPDGYTMFTVGNTQVIVPLVYGKAPYDLARDIAPLTTTATIVNVLAVNPSLPAKTTAELVALSKAKPNTIRFGSGGTGGVTHLMGEYFKSLSGADATHVPYKAGILSINATMSGEVQMVFLNGFNATPLVNSGKLRGLGVTSLKRSRYFPNLPTLDEAGLKGYELQEFHSVALPRGTPQPQVKRLHAELTKAMASADLVEKLNLQGAEPAPRSPEQFRDFLKAEHVKYEKIVTTVGIKPE